jgi:ABC-2 type transport system permease protein
VRAGAVKAGFKQQCIQFFADPQWLIPSLISPFLFAMVMIFIGSRGGAVQGPIVLQAVLGGGVLGMWANSLFASSSSVSFDRINGTFEPMIRTGTRIVYVLAGRSLWNVTIGLVNAAAVFVIAELMFGTGMKLANPALFFLTLIMTLLSLSCVGLLISALFVFTRKGATISAIMEYPIYVMSGALVPVTVLPGWMQAVSKLLPPTWGVDAIKYAALPGFEGMMGVSFGVSVIVCIFFSIAFAAAAYFLLIFVERRILASGTAELF